MQTETGMTRRRGHPEAFARGVALCPRFATLRAGVPRQMIDLGYGAPATSTPEVICPIMALPVKTRRHPLETRNLELVGVCDHLRDDGPCAIDRLDSPRR